MSTAASVNEAWNSRADTASSSTRHRRASSPTSSGATRCSTGTTTDSCVSAVSCGTGHASP